MSIKIINVGKVEVVSFYRWPRWVSLLPWRTFFCHAGWPYPCSMTVWSLVFVVVKADPQQMGQIRTSLAFYLFVLELWKEKPKPNAGYIRVLSDKNAEVVRLLLCWQDSWGSYGIKSERIRKKLVNKIWA